MQAEAVVGAPSDSHRHLVYHSAEGQGGRVVKVVDGEGGDGGE